VNRWPIAAVLIDDGHQRDDRFRRRTVADGAITMAVSLDLGPDPSASVQDLLEITGVRRRVEHKLAAFFLARRASASSQAAEDTLTGPIADLVLAGGKRIRAAMCY
jgi:hypothetical protein